MHRLAFSADGLTLATAGDDKTARIWDASPIQESERKDILIFRDHDSLVYGASFSPNEALIASSSLDGTAKIWESASGRVLHTLGGHGGAVLCVAFRPDGLALATGGADGVTRIWDAATGEEILNFAGLVGRFSRWRFAPMAWCWQRAMDRAW